MKFLLLASILFSNIAFAANISIISDFDDTIKRSNIPDMGERTVGNSILWEKAYGGMPELFRELDLETNGLYILSASPLIVKPLIYKLLDHYDFQYKKVFTRNFFATEDKEEYKKDRIYKVIKESGDKVILFGDDVEVDHDIYAEIAANKPESVEQIYIHTVANDKKMSAGVFKYFTAFEVAVNEYQNNRLNLNQVELVADSILNTSLGKMYRVIPHYAYCPKDQSDFSHTTPPELITLKEKVEEKIISYCSERN